MSGIYIETRRLVISPLDESNYEYITKLYKELKNERAEIDVFGRIEEGRVEKALEFDSKAETGFNLMAKSKEKNEFVGYLKGSLPKSGGMWVYTLAISSSMRRMGYGREFVSALSEHMRNTRNIRFISLSVMEGNKNAIYFWESMGFKKDKTLIKSGLFKDKLSKINIFVKLF